MSRLIVKNLPKKITEESLRKSFSQKGTITDIQLKYTKDGVFRQFAFIGYENESEAEAAIKYFHNSCIQTSRIKVEFCSTLGGEDKPKSWSKYAKDSTAYRKAHGIDQLEFEERKKEREELKKNKPKNKIDEIIGEHKNDPKFIEFMQAHDKNRTLWSNDAEMNEDSLVWINNQKDQVKKNNFEDHDSGVETKKELTENEDEDENDNGSDEKNEDDSNNDTKKLAEDIISDLDYMKQLKTSANKLEKNVNSKDSKNDLSKKDDLFTIKIHDIPYSTKRQDILKFFKPLKPFSVRLPTNVKGFCYVGFKQEKDFKKALLKDKSFIKGKQVFFSDFTEKNKITKSQKTNSDVNELNLNSNKSSQWLKQEESVRTEEDISETGKIFFRNLSYTVNEDDLTKLFEKYGPIAEINLPIDTFTRKIKGFGTVSFVMPEHAVRAFNELDGSTFHGRLFHLIPGKSSKNDDEDNIEGLSYKAKKELLLKKSAGQTHNWNTLFLGANAVADILASRFNKSKEEILDTSTGGTSAAVRLALGETQIVMEMKQFLEDCDVQLSAFDTPPKKRSKTVILAKNLPAETIVSELKPLFSKFGLVGRLVLPPSGVTALIEFLDSSEAKKAFQKLAYSKFKDLPLYLEWAPENTFKTTIDGEKIEELKNEHEKENSSLEAAQKNEKNIKVKSTNEEETKNTVEQQEEEDEDEAPEPETTLFLRNLNFKTREPAVRNHFKHVGPIHIVQVAMRKDAADPSKTTSLGYGFIQFKQKKSTEKALKEMQFTTIEGNQVELKRSDRTLKLDEKSAKKLNKIKKQTGTKMLVRNIPFQAKTKEIYELFKVFGELRSVRLPKKATPGEESHRGFGFVDYITKADAKKAFEALCSSTHLYGRRLVLEWASVNDTDVEEIRKRTALDFGGGSKPKQSKKAIFDDSNIPAKSNEDDIDE